MTDQKPKHLLGDPPPERYINRGEYEALFESLIMEAYQGYFKLDPSGKSLIKYGGLAVVAVHDPLNLQAFYQSILDKMELMLILPENRKQRKLELVDIALCHNFRRYFKPSSEPDYKIVCFNKPYTLLNTDGLELKNLFRDTVNTFRTL